MADGFNTGVTFRFDGVAEHVYLCLQPCEERATADTGRGAGGWQTRALSELSPGVWVKSLRLQPGWWRFRYYTEERGRLFYAEPSESVLQMDGLDAMLHVSRAAEEAVGRVSPGDVPSRSDQYLCILPEDDHADALETGAAEEATFSPPTSIEGPQHDSESAASDSRRHHRRRGRTAFDGCEETNYHGSQAEALWRRCARAAGGGGRTQRFRHAFEDVERR